MFRRLSTAQLVVDIAVSVVFLLFCSLTILPFGYSSYGPVGDAGAVLVALGMSASLALRRLSPGLALALAWTTALGQMAAGLSPLPANLAVFGVLYVTAAYGSRLLFWLGFASSFIGAIAIAVYLVLVSPMLTGAGLTWQSIPVAFLVLIAAVFALLLAWTAGALVRSILRTRDTRAAQQRAEATAIAEAERNRIARDMHDVVAHSLAVVIAQADGARYAAVADPDAPVAALGTISTTARAALADVRMLLTQLRHSEAQGPQPGLADLDELYDQVRAAGVRLRVDVAPVPQADTPASVQLAVFRILQEALTNALRHGGEGRVHVRLAWHADRVELSVQNALPGDTQPQSSRGHGVIGMRERAQLVGGRFEAAPAGADFLVRATLPIEVTA